MMQKLIYRNVNLYVRDKASVFFSLMGALILILVYVLFLSGNQLDSVRQQVGGTINKDNLSYLINSWILAGILSVTTLTSTLGALGFMVTDKEKKIIRDFKSSPLTMSTYPISAVITGILIGVIISLIVFIVYGSYIFFATGYLFSLPVISKTLGLIFISALMNASLMGLLVSFISTNNAFSAVSLIIGTSIGFVNGMYIPIGQLSETVQNILKVLPFSHIASLFRQVLMGESIAVTFSGAPQEAVDSYINILGVALSWNDKVIPLTVSIVFILAVTLISLILFFINFKRKKEMI